MQVNKIADLAYNRTPAASTSETIILNEASWILQAASEPEVFAIGGLAIKRPIAEARGNPENIEVTRRVST